MKARFNRYLINQKALVEGMRSLGFKTLIDDEFQSPIITSFHYPDLPGFNFQNFYDSLKRCGFVIYPGKVSNAECFRIGTIGDVCKEDVLELLNKIEEIIIRLKEV